MRFSVLDTIIGAGDYHGPYRRSLGQSCVSGQSTSNSV